MICYVFIVVVRVYICFSYYLLLCSAANEDTQKAIRSNNNQLIITRREVGYLKEEFKSTTSSLQDELKSTISALQAAQVTITRLNAAKNRLNQEHEDFTASAPTMMTNVVKNTWNKTKEELIALNEKISGRLIVLSYLICFLLSILPSRCFFTLVGNFHLSDFVFFYLTSLLLS